MPEHDARRPDADAKSLANRIKEIRQTETRLVGDLQSCIDSTNNLLERLGKTPDDETDGASGESSLEVG